MDHWKKNSRGITLKGGGVQHEMNANILLT